MIGWREWVALPALGIERIKAKLDTGARTSALHAFDLHASWQDGQLWVEFAVHPLQRNDEVEQFCRAPVLDQRWVVSSSGHRERRYVIATPLRIGAHEYPVEVTLTNRDEMGFRMLIGRTAMHRRLIVDPSTSYRAGKARRRRRVTSKPRKVVKRKAVP